MTATLFWCVVAGVGALWFVERNEHRTDQARQDLDRRARMDQLDHQARLATDPEYQAALPAALAAFEEACAPDPALQEDLEVEWLENLYLLPSAPGGVPLSAIHRRGPTPHGLPSRPAKHSPHRHRRGF